MEQGLTVPQPRWSLVISCMDKDILSGYNPSLRSGTVALTATTPPTLSVSLKLPR